MPGRPDLRIHWYHQPDGAHTGCGAPDCPRCLRTAGRNAPLPGELRPVHPGTQQHHDHLQARIVRARARVNRRRHTAAEWTHRIRAKLTERFAATEQLTEAPLPPTAAPPSETGPRSDAAVPLRGRGDIDDSDDSTVHPMPTDAFFARLAATPPMERISLHGLSPELLREHFLPLDADGLALEVATDWFASIRPMSLLTGYAHHHWTDPIDELRRIRYGGVSALVQVTGHHVGELWRLDAVVIRYMLDNLVPNCTVSVVSSDGRLVYIRAFTWFGKMLELERRMSALPECQVPWTYVVSTPHSQFRIASQTKSVTAAAVHKIIRDTALTSSSLTRLTLNTPFMDVLSRADNAPPLTDLQNRVFFSPVSGTWQIDLHDIRIRHLLQHRSGWCDSATGCAAGGVYAPFYDPALDYWEGDVGSRFRPPVGIADTIAHALGTDQRGFALHNGSAGWVPASAGRFSYSNFGYVVLGRVVEHFWGGSWYDGVQSRLFASPYYGMTDTVLLRTAEEGRRADEVRYYASFSVDVSAMQETDYPEDWRLRPYGGNGNYESGDAPFGLVSNAVDMARWIVNLRWIHLPRAEPDHPLIDADEVSPHELNTPVRLLWLSSFPAAGSTDGHGLCRDTTPALWGGVLPEVSPPSGSPYLQPIPIPPVWHTGTLRGANGGIYVFPPYSVAPGGSTLLSASQVPPFSNAAFHYSMNRWGTASTLAGSGTGIATPSPGATWRPSDEEGSYHRGRGPRLMWVLRDAMVNDPVLSSEGWGAAGEDLFRIYV